MKEARSTTTEEVHEKYDDLADICGVIEAGNSADCVSFANAWRHYADALKAANTYVFRAFTEWDGDARETFEGNFNAQQGWLDGMVTACVQLADQAEGLAGAHDTLKGSHIEYDDGMYYRAQVEELEDEYASYDDRVAEHANKRQKILDKLSDLSDASTTLIGTYGSSCSLPNLDYHNCDAGINIEPPRKHYRPGSDPGSDPGSKTVPRSGPDIPDPTGMPSTSDTGTPDDAMPDDATPGVEMPVASKGSGAGAGGVKPASFEGGMPLQSAVDADAAARAAGLGAGGSGRGIPGAGGAMGGGGMGGVPMGGGGQGGQGKDQGKGKRVEGEDESLYTEDRPWTEAFIGSLRRKDVSDGKGSQ